MRRLLTALIVAAIAALGIASGAAAAGVENGRIAFADFISGQIYSIDPDGSDRLQLTNTSQRMATDFPSWSPDGERILFTKFRTDDPDDHSRIWVMDADGTDKRKVADDAPGFRDYGPEYTPNERQIVFARCQPDDGVCAIWRMRADGTHKRALTPYVHSAENEVVDFDPSVSPDGTRVAFARFFDGGIVARVFVMNLDGSDPHAITPPRYEGFGPDWSPNGGRIAFTSNGGRTGSGGFTVRPNGTDIEQVTPDVFPRNDAFFSYSPLGDRLAFSSDRNFSDGCCLELFTVASSGGSGQLVDVGLSPPGVIHPDWGTAPRLP